MGMKLSNGEKVEKLEININDAGWDWVVNDNPFLEVLHHKDINKLNKALNKAGVKVETLGKELNQNLCG
jgi:hypothetical protein